MACVHHQLRVTAKLEFQAGYCCMRLFHHGMVGQLTDARTGIAAFQRF